MKSIAFFNNKGGVSKTTSVLNIAYILGEVYGRKVLVVDCDGQQNASRFLADELTEVGVEKTLINAAVSPREALSTTRYEHIDVLTSTTDMNRCAEQFQSLSEAEREKNLSKLSGFWSDQYDYVLLDLPPALNSLTEQLIGITDGVIVPVELDRTTYQLGLKGKSWKINLVHDLDVAVEQCKSKEDFISFLRGKDYSVRYTDSHIAITKNGEKKGIRVDTLARQFGDKYKKASLEKNMGYYTAPSQETVRPIQQKNVFHSSGKSYWEHYEQHLFKERHYLPSKQNNVVRDYEAERLVSYAETIY